MSLWSKIKIKRISKLYDIQQESEQFIKHETNVLIKNGYDNIYLMTKKIIDDIVYKNLEIDVAFAKLVGAYHFFNYDNNINDNNTYLKFLIYFVLYIVFPSNNFYPLTKSVVCGFMPNYLVIDCLFKLSCINHYHIKFKYCGTSYQDTLCCVSNCTYFINFNYYEPDGIASIITDYTQFKWSQFIQLICEFFNAFGPIHTPYIFGAMAANPNTMLPIQQEYNLYRMIDHELNGQILRNKEIEEIIFEIERITLNMIHSNSNNDNYNMELIHFTSYLTVYPPWVAAKHWLGLFYVIFNENSDELCQYFVATTDFDRKFRYARMDILENAERTKKAYLDDDDPISMKLFENNMLYVVNTIFLRYLAPLITKHKHILWYIVFSMMEFYHKLRYWKKWEHAKIVSDMTIYCFSNPVISKHIVDNLEALTNGKNFKYYARSTSEQIFIHFETILNAKAKNNQETRLLPVETCTANIINDINANADQSSCFGISFLRNLSAFFINK